MASLLRHPSGSTSINFCYRSSSITITSPPANQPSFAHPEPAVLSAAKPASYKRHHVVSTDIFESLLHAFGHPSSIQRPIIVRNVALRAWEIFRDRYGCHPAFAQSRFNSPPTPKTGDRDLLTRLWEYDNIKKKIIAIPLPAPFHDFSVTVMGDHIHHGMTAANLDTRARIRSLRVNRENMQKATPTGTSQREADCVVYTRDYHSGIIPTIVWEVGHSQKRKSLIRRAKMWCRRYNGKLRVVILVKYLCRNPRIDSSAVLLVYRPAIRGDGKWTAAQDGPTYTIFPRPSDAGSESDAVPLLYEDYFGPGNRGTGKTGLERFDLPLQLVREMIEESVGVTIGREGYRYVSGGSSVGGAEDVVSEQHIEQNLEDREGLQHRGGYLPQEPASPIPAGEEYHEFEDDWDAAMSDVSDDP